MKHFVIGVLTMFLTMFIICYKDYKDYHREQPEIVDTPPTYCIRGVVYYQLGHSASVAYNRDSTVITCDMGNGNVNK